MKKFITVLLLACFLFQGCAERKNGYIMKRFKGDSACIQGHIFYDVSQSDNRGWVPKFDENGKPCDCDTTKCNP
jgi:hypothetical protein